MASAWRTAARRAPPSKKVQLSSSETVAKLLPLPNSYSSPWMPPSAPNDKRRPPVGARDFRLRLARARQCLELRELGTILERGCAQLRECARGRADVGGDLGILERGVERAIEQEVEIALRLRRAVLRVARLLHDLEQFRARAQHLVLRHLAVAEQRFVDAQVFVEQHDARVDDAARAHRGELREVADRDVALQTATERLVRDIRLRRATRAARAPPRGSRARAAACAA